MSRFDVGRFMDKAQRADRQALFAALQAAMIALGEARIKGAVAEDDLAEVERRLDLGVPYGYGPEAGT